MSKQASAKTKGGCIMRLLLSVCLLAALLLAVVLALVMVPQDLSDIGGYGKDPATAEVRDLRAVLEQSVIRGHAVTLKEEEINLWLGKKVKMRQEGLLAGKVTHQRVWIRLDGDLAEVILEREVFGWRSTFSMFLQIEQRDTGDGIFKEVELHGGSYLEAFPGVLRGGRFGRLVVPQGYLHLIKPAYAALAVACAEEIHLAFDEMMGIRIEDGQLVLDPRKAVDQSQPLR